MTDTTGLPPGCKPLTFDPNDRATWKSKLWFDGVEYQPAEIVCVQNNVMLIVLSSIARCSFWLIEPHKYGRLYDAAPEPVKPREWWADKAIVQQALAVLRAIAEGYPVEGTDDRYVVVENPAYRPDDGSDPKLVFDVGFGEAPEDQA